MDKQTMDKVRKTWARSMDHVWQDMQEIVYRFEDSVKEFNKLVNVVTFEQKEVFTSSMTHVIKAMRFNEEVTGKIQDTIHHIENNPKRISLQWMIEYLGEIQKSVDKVKNEINLMHKDD